MIKTYYWNKKENFGDLLGPLLIKHFLHFPTEWGDPFTSDLTLVGSIAEHISIDYTGIIAGVGCLKGETKKRFPRAKILSLRGPLTARNLGMSPPTLGDPALLADELVPNQDKQYHLGLVPHWSDDTLAKNPIFLKYNPLIINVADDPLKVIAQIGQCRKIVSSSLHGIILADAFAIPRRVEIPPPLLQNPQLDGGTFKWKDYHASINMPFEIGITKEPDRNIIIERQHEIFDVLEEIKALLQKANRA